MPKKNFLLLVRQKGERNWLPFELANLFAIYTLLDATFRRDIVLETKVVEEQDYYEGLSQELPFDVEE